MKHSVTLYFQARTWIETLELCNPFLSSLWRAFNWLDFFDHIFDWLEYTETTISTVNSSSDMLLQKSPLSIHVFSIISQLQITSNNSKAPGIDRALACVQLQRGCESWPVSWAWEQWDDRHWGKAQQRAETLGGWWPHYLGLNTLTTLPYYYFRACVATTHTFWHQGVGVKFRCLAV